MLYQYSPWVGRRFLWVITAIAALQLTGCAPTDEDMAQAARQAATQTAAQTTPVSNHTGETSVLESTDLGVSRRRFEAGARSNWHSHAYGQLIFVQEGRARTQERGESIHELSQGDSEYALPDVEHWHGAAFDEAFVQVAVGFGRGITRLEPVSDEQYRGR